MKLRFVRVAVILLATGTASWTAAQPTSAQPTQSPAPTDKPLLPNTSPRPGVSGPVDSRNIPAGADEKPIITASLSVTWSANKDAVWAYSDKTGVWATQKLEPKFEIIKPLITGKVCILIQDFSYYGFSAETGTWDVLRLAKGNGTIPELNIIGDNCSVTTDDNVYSFSVVKGVWSWPDKTGGTRNEPGVKPASGAPNQREPAGDKGRTEADDAELRDVVKRLRAMLHTHDRRHSEVQKLESELRDVLGRIFDRRQQIQRDELALLQERMSTIQKRIEDRANSRKNIIDRFVDDLVRESPNASDKSTTEATNPAPRQSGDGIQLRTPLLEFRIVAQPADSRFEPRVPNDFGLRKYPTNSVVDREVPKDKGFVWVRMAEAKEIIPALPVERMDVANVREVLLADTPEHSLSFNGKWSIDDCRIVPDPNGKDRFMIELKLSEAGGVAFGTLTKSHLGQRIAIVVNDKIVAAPIIRNPIGRDVAITGKFTREQADKLAALIPAGNLPLAGDAAVAQKLPIIATNEMVAKELQPFQGRWQFEGCESETWAAPVAEVRKWQWRIEGNKITWTESDGNESNMSFTIDRAKSPKELDITFLSGPQKDKRCRGIYEFKRGMLWLCLQDPGAKVDRPTGFSFTGAGGRTLIVLVPAQATTPSDEISAMQGTWKISVCQSRWWPVWRPTAEAEFPNWRWSVKENEMSWTGVSTGDMRVSFVVDPVRSPKRIDFTFLDGPHKGEKCPGVYELKAGRFWVCLADPGAKADRPIDFSMTTNGGCSLLILDPVAPSAANTSADATSKRSGEPAQRSFQK